MKGNTSIIIILLFMLSFLVRAYSQCHYTKMILVSDSLYCHNTTYELVFEDEFMGDGLDETKWEILEGTTNSYNMKKQKFHLHKEWSQRENIVVQNGILRIITQRETRPDMPFVALWEPYTILKDSFDYTSGAIASRNRFPINGRFEARIKLPSSYGLWPAFWLYGEVDGLYNEIDIFEAYTSTRTLNSNLYFSEIGGYKTASSCMKRNMRSIEKETGIGFDSLCSDFFIYSLVWSEDRIEWYINGRLFRREPRYIRKSLFGLLRNEYYCNNFKPNEKYMVNLSFPIGDMAIMLNTAVMLNGDSPMPDTQFPAIMEIDYIRVFAKKDIITKN